MGIAIFVLGIVPFIIICTLLSLSPFWLVINCLRSGMEPKRKVLWCVAAFLFPMPVVPLYVYKGNPNPKMQRLFKRLIKISILSALLGLVGVLINVKTSKKEQARAEKSARQMKELEVKRQKLLAQKQAEAARQTQADSAKPAAPTMPVVPEKIKQQGQDKPASAATGTAQKNRKNKKRKKRKQKSEAKAAQRAELAQSSEQSVQPLKVAAPNAVPVATTPVVKTAPKPAKQVAAPRVQEFVAPLPVGVCPWELKGLVRIQDQAAVFLEQRQTGQTLLMRQGETVLNVSVIAIHGPAVSLEVNGQRWELSFVEH